MFYNRNDYLDSLIKGRTAEDVAFSPEPLMELLIDSALNYYGNLIETAQDIFIVAES